MIRVVVIDQLKLSRTMITSVLQREPDIEVMDVAATLDEASAWVDSCDVMLVNVLDEDGIRPPDLVRAVTRVAPSARVVVMGLPRDKEFIVRQMEAGIAGYVLRDDSVEQMLQTIRAAARGQAMVTPDVAGALMSRVAQLAIACQDSWADTQSGDLSAREREVLELVRQGLSNQDIAMALTIEVGTVKNHIHSILRKLNVRSRHDAVAFLLVPSGELAAIDPNGRGPVGYS